MGNGQSMQKINFEDVQTAYKNPEIYLLINTLSELDQGCLIEVVEVVGNRVVVRQAVAAPTDEPHSKVNP